jgi:hypothetical protein
LLLDVEKREELGVNDDNYTSEFRTYGKRDEGKCEELDINDSDYSGDFQDLQEEG